MPNLIGQKSSKVQVDTITVIYFEQLMILLTCI
jgi:hypothetical protein